MAINIDGLITGIDTGTIIDGLLKIQKQQVDRFAARKAVVQEKQGAFNALETRLLGLQLDVSKLSRSQNNPFTKQKVVVNDDTAVAATASESAASGVYNFRVDSVAAAHQVASQGFSDVDSEITQGTFQFRVGSGDVTTVTINENNNTLEGITDAINGAGANVTATIVKDSAGGSAPYRLILTSSRTGAENNISITNGLAADSGSAVRPEIDFGTPVQAATDATITFGSGAGAISTTSSTNRFSSVIRGVTFDLLQATVGDELSITIERDVDSAVSDVQTFVQSFNDVIQYVDDQSRYVPSTGESGPLQGNRSVQSIQQKLRSAVLDVVTGVDTSLNRLSTIGVSVTDAGRLSLNTSRLKDVLSGKVEGVSAGDVKRLFAIDGRSDNPSVSFVLGNSKTQASGTPIQVDVTQAPERALITATGELAASTAINSSNNELTIKIDGAEATLTLADGVYTRQELTDLLETTINNSTALAGRQVSAGLSGNSLELTSNSYGASSKLEIVGGSVLADLGLTAGQTASGKDVSGSFLVDGQTELATGRGRLLTGAKSNEFTEGLQIRVALTPSQVTSSAEAEVTVTQGIGAKLGKLLDDILSGDSGLASTTNDGFRTQLSDLQGALDRQQDVFNRQQEQLLKQFSALETAMSQLQSTSNFVASQLAGLIT